jgi:hypothetical protein
MKVGCQYHFTVSEYWAEEGVLQIKLHQDRHVNKQGRVCHGSGTAHA